MNANGVKETTATTGTGTVTLAAVTGYVRFSEGQTVGDVVPYAINSGNDWEWGFGTVGAANTLARTTITATYVAGVYDNTSPTAITLAGTSTVYLTPHVDFLAAPGPIGATTPSTVAMTKSTVTAGTHTLATERVSTQSVTWNGAGVKMVARDLDVTDTASDTESYLDQYKVGGVRKTGIRKDGALILWNGANDDTNYERGFIRWASNVLEIGAEKGGTGTQREVRFPTSSSRKVTIYNGASRYGEIYNDGSNTVINDPVVKVILSGGQGVGILGAGSNAYIFNSTTGIIDIGRDLSAPGFIFGPRATDTATYNFTIAGQGAYASAATNLAGGHLYFRGGAGASSSAGNAHGGNVYLRGGQGYGTGHHGYLYLGDSNTGGISVFNATPSAQHSSTGETTGFTAGSGTAVNHDSTFTGNVGSTAYTFSDVVKALKNYGWMAA